MKPLVVLDVSNLSHRNWYALVASLGFGNAKPVIYGLLRDLHTLNRVFGSCDFAFCFDGTTYARSEDFPLYKSNRIAKPEKSQIQKGLDTLYSSVLPALGYRNIFRFDRYEADDLMGFLAVENSDREMHLVSNDSDLYQLLVHPNVYIWNASTKATIGKSWVESQYGIPAGRWCEYKALTGCKADNIVGVKGVGQQTAVEYMTGRLSPTRHTILKRIEESGELMLQNMKLVGLPYYKLQDPGMELQAGEPTAATWDDVCELYKVETLIGKVPR